MIQLTPFLTLPTTLLSFLPPLLLFLPSVQTTGNNNTTREDKTHTLHFSACLSINSSSGSFAFSLPR